MKIKGFKILKKCQNQVGSHAQPYKEGDGKIQDYFDEVGLDMVTNSQVTTNFEFLFDLDVL